MTKINKTSHNLSFLEATFIAEFDYFDTVNSGIFGIVVVARKYNGCKYFDVFDKVTQ